MVRGCPFLLPSVPPPFFPRKRKEHTKEKSTPQWTPFLFILHFGGYGWTIPFSFSPHKYSNRVFFFLCKIGNASPFPCYTPPQFPFYYCVPSPSPCSPFSSLRVPPSSFPFSRLSIKPLPKCKKLMNQDPFFVASLFFSSFLPIHQSFFIVLE